MFTETIRSLCLCEKILLYSRDQIGVFSIPVVLVGQLKCGSESTKEIIDNSVDMEWTMWYCCGKPMLKFCFVLKQVVPINWEVKVEQNMRHIKITSKVRLCVIRKALRRILEHWKDKENLNTKQITNPSEGFFEKHSLIDIGKMCSSGEHVN